MYDDGSNRPKLQIPYSKAEKLMGITAAAGVLLAVAITFIYYDKLPKRMAIHFDFSGKPNGWGGKETLIMLPIILVVMYLLLTGLEKVPHIYNYTVKINEKNAKAQYKNARAMLIVLKTEVVYLFAYMQWITIEGALNNTLGLSPWFIVIAMIFIFGSIGYFIYKSVKLK